MKTILWGSFFLGLALIPQEETNDPGGAGVQLSDSCARCHSNAATATAMRDSAGHGIAPYDLWQGTLMANSARDPLWRAVVSAEVAATPSRRAEIEATCLACHAPMADQVGLDDHGTGSLMHVLDCDSDLGELARDGVSCTVCHGMSPAGLGTAASFSAGFVLDDQRRLFGPHRDPFAMPMRAHTGFTPTYSDHVTESALCGSCHTLETDALDPEGNTVGARLLEQAPYLEWLNSDFRDEGEQPGLLAASCQDCHAPAQEEGGEATRTRIARNPGGRDFPPTEPRSPFGRHVFVGGNTLVLSMLRDHREELRVVASKASLQATLDATREQLENRTARIEIDEVERSDGSLRFRVEVENLTGHKLPTAHPTRRAWLRVLVRDADGQVVFACGDHDEEGRIVDARGEPLASEGAGGPIEPHRNRVERSADLVVYRAVMADADGAATHTLMRGASWLKDSRLLPKGWSAEYAGAERTAPIGTESDGNFRDGRDQIQFALELRAEGPLTVEASLLYQTLSARWADELFRWETPEIDSFRKLYSGAPRTPETLARTVIETP